MNGSAATLNVPAGANHDLWVTGNNICSFDATFSGTYNIVWFENPRGSGGNPATDTW
jgi:hypothetical protein